MIKRKLYNAIYVHQVQEECGKEVEKKRSEKENFAMLHVYATSTCYM